MALLVLGRVVACIYLEESKSSIVRHKTTKNTYDDQNDLRVDGNSPQTDGHIGRVIPRISEQWLERESRPNSLQDPFLKSWLVNVPPP